MQLSLPMDIRQRKAGKGRSRQEEERGGKQGEWLATGHLIHQTKR